MTTQTSSSLDQISGDYTLDPAHSRLGFVARHAMVTKVRGTFKDFAASLHVDAADPSKSSARVTIQAASIDTGNSDRDAHLRTNDFFAMDEFPTITFESTRVAKVGDDTYRLSGDLSIRGVIKPVTVDFELAGAADDPWGNHRIGFEGSVTLNRKDWGINWNSPLGAGGVLVSDKVTLELDLSAIKS
ncbi:MAG: YceI family protein [Acidimicrobiales bacterium]